MDACPICKEYFGNGIKTVTLQDTGAHTVNGASLNRGLNINVVSGTIVHERCRLDFTNKKEIEITKRKKESDGELVAADSTVKRRSQCSSFRFDYNCFFCGLEISDR
ncbi:hypothetical protein SNE40_000027 [Patella caerulea]|uniref:Uncharacterized protein n=1 Tax=Patella caerulea TaxID=87958 RepID=A0AAN8K4H0_PATCE